MANRNLSSNLLTSRPYKGQMNEIQLKRKKNLIDRLFRREINQPKIIYIK